jgi:hypothetical protein
VPIIDQQRRLREAGRIRIGQQVPITSGPSKGKTRPERLDRFRLTCPDRETLVQVAALYGGEVTQWSGGAGQQWEVVTEASVLPVLLPPAQLAFSQWLELWAGGGCLRRCDGERMTSDEPCMCNPEERECKPHTRLSLILADLEGIGLWRLDTQGHYAAAEMAGAIELVQLLGVARLVPGRLLLEQREVKRPNEPARRFVVPVLDLDISLRQVAGLSPVPRPELTPSTAEQLHAIESPAGRATRHAELPPTGVPVGPQEDADGRTHKRPPGASLGKRVLAQTLAAMDPTDREECKAYLRETYGSAAGMTDEQVDAAVDIAQTWGQRPFADDEPVPLVPVGPADD